MKRSLILLGMVLLGLGMSANAQVGKICNWDGDKKAAVVLTFDDWSPGQYPIAGPELSSRSITGTFFVTTNLVNTSSNTWPAVRILANAGNEIANHTFDHPSLTTMSAAQLKTQIRDVKATIDAQVTTQKVVSFAYPFGLGGSNNTAENVVKDSVKASGHIGARSVNPASNNYTYNFAPTLDDYYRILTFSMDGTVSTGAFSTQISNIIAGGGLLTVLYHSLDNAGGTYGDNWYAQVLQTAFQAQLNALIAQRQKVWITTFGNSIKYHRERKSATLSQVQAPNGSTWVVNLTDTLANNSIYNQPLTLKLKMNSVNYNSVKQNGVTLKIDSVYSDTIMFRAVPDGGNITLSTSGATAGQNLSIKDSTFYNGSATIPVYAITWTDNIGKPRSVVMTKPNPGNNYPGVCVIIKYYDQNNNLVTIKSNTPNDPEIHNRGFGATVHHIQGGTWIDQGPNPTLSIRKQGAHYAIIDLVQVVDGATETVTYSFYDGLDYFQWQETVQCGKVSYVKDSRGPYSTVDWDGNGAFDVIDGQEYGAQKYLSQPSFTANSGAYTFGGTCDIPYVQQWKNGKEIGFVQTQTYSQQLAGSPEFSATNIPATGTNANLTANSWALDFQMNIYDQLQKLTWGMPYGYMEGVPAPGLTLAGTKGGYGQYSLSIVFDALTAAGVKRIMNENRIIQNGNVTVAATLGSVVTTGPVGTMNPATQTLVPAGYDHNYRTWWLQANGSDQAQITMNVATGTLRNPTFRIKSMSQLPSVVSLNGTLLVANTDYYASYDATGTEAWVTLLKTLSGSNSILFQGNNTGITIVSAKVTPNNLSNRLSTTLSFNVTASTSGTITSVKLDLSSIGGSALAVMTSTGGNNYAYNFVLPAGYATGVKTISATVTDLVGNVQTATIPLTITSGITIASASVTPSSIVNNVSNGLSFALNATDDGSIASVKLDLTSLGGGSSVTMSSAAGNNFNLSYTAPAGLASGTKTITATVTDNQGNTKTTTISVIVNSAVSYTAIYTDASSMICPACIWNANGTIVEQSAGGANEGMKDYSFTYNVVGYYAGVGLNVSNWGASPVNFTGNDSLQFAYQGPVGAGTSITLQVIDATTAKSSFLTFPASSTYTVVKVPLSAIVGVNLASVTELDFAIGGVASGSGTLRIDNIVLIKKLATPPALTGSIAGINSLCVGASTSYSITTATGATSYSWTVPAGWTISSGNGTKTLNVIAGSTSGNISVVPIGAAGTGAGLNLSVTVSASTTPSVSITSSATSVCSGGNVTLTASGTNSGTTPTYTWFKNGISQTTGTTYNLIPANGDAITARVTAGGTLPTCLSATTASSNSIGLTVTGALTPTVAIAASATSVCSGGNVTLTASGTNSGTTPTYTWFKNGISQTTGTTYNLIPANGDAITARVIAGGTLPTCLSATTASSNSIGLTVTGALTPTVAIVSSATSVCSGGNVTLTASGTNSGTTPTYTWFKNGISQTTGTTYNVIPANGDAITARVTAGGTVPTCLSATTASSNSIGLTVTGALTPTVAIASNATSVCSGGNVTLTASGTNSGTTPTYTWFRNGVSQTTGTTYNLIPANGDAITARVTAGGTLPTCLSATTAGSNSIGLIVTGALTPTVAIVSNATSVCSGGNVTLTASGTNSGTTPTYTWFKNGVSQTTGITYSLIPVNGDAITARVTSGGTLPTCLTSTTASSNSIGLTVTGTLTPTVAIVSSSTSVCSGGNVTLTASGTNSGTSPTYTWFKNGVSQTTGTTYSLIPTNGDAITSRVTAGGTLPSCLSATTASSNSIGITVIGALTPTVAIASSATSICSGGNVTLTASGTNSGTAPTYTWFKNGVSQTTGTTYNLIPANGDAITARATAGGTVPTCLSTTTASSNSIGLTVTGNLTPTVAISSSTTSVCSGGNVTFTASGTNSGTTSTYTWFKNGVSQTTGTTYNLIPTNGDAITARVTVGGTLPTCLSATTSSSNSIGLTVVTNVIPSVSIASNQTSVCSGTGISLTATGVNAGSTPVYAWFVNNLQVATGLNYSYVPKAGDLVKASLTASGACLSGNPAASNVVAITVNPLVQASVSVAPSANPVCANTSVTYTATPTNGGSAPIYSWFVNGNLQSGSAATFNNIPANNDVISVKMTTGGTLGNCVSNITATSTGTVATVNGSISTELKIAPSTTSICLGSPVTFNSTASGTGSTPVYAWFVNSTPQSSTNATFSYTPANGDIVTASMTPGGSGITCVTGGTANAAGVALTVQSTQTASASVLSTGTNYCSGQSASFTVSGSNLGTAPTFTWFVNNQIQSNGPVFSYSPSNGDVVKAIGTAGGTLPVCLASSSVTSAGTNLVVNPLVSPSVSVIASATSVCSGTGLTFTATGTNVGTSPTYAWFVNNAFISLGNVLNFNPSNNDQVKANVIIGGSLPTCLSTSSVTSNIIGLTVTICPKPQVSSITGPSFVLDGSTNVSYSVPTISGDTYAWTIPTGVTIVSGQGTSTIVLNFGTNVNGNLSLTQTNANGSTSVQLSIQSGIAPGLGTIAGLNAVTQSQTGVVYTVPSVSNTTYQWSVPAGATITSGQGTNSISVDFGTSVTGTVSVTGTNAFGTSSTSLTISQTIPTEIMNSDAVPTISVYPNPSNEFFHLESVNGEIKAFNLQGDLIETKSVFGEANLGENYPAGVYFLQFSNGASTKNTIRVVKIK